MENGHNPALGMATWPTPTRVSLSRLSSRLDRFQDIRKLPKTNERIFISTGKTSYETPCMPPDPTYGIMFAECPGLHWALNYSSFEEAVVDLCGGELAQTLLQTGTQSPGLLRLRRKQTSLPSCPSLTEPGAQPDR